MGKVLTNSLLNVRQGCGQKKPNVVRRMETSPDTVENSPNVHTLLRGYLSRSAIVPAFPLYT